MCKEGANIFAKIWIMFAQIFTKTKKGDFWGALDNLTIINRAIFLLIFSNNVSYYKRLHNNTA
jgi:hypothetical protein